uniref:Arrestin-C n=1 Tax=Pseudonaja textilis TaxID=8673 RepID=A0A670YSV4_PSETE
MGLWRAQPPQFMMSDKPLHLEASMDKEVSVAGFTPVSPFFSPVDQLTDVVLYSLDNYVKTVCSEEFVENVAANSTFSKTFTVTPLLSNNREKRGLALDGKLKHEDTNLASTTILRPGMDKEVLGILVSYKVKVTLVAHHSLSPLTLVSPPPHIPWTYRNSYSPMGHVHSPESSIRLSSLNFAWQKLWSPGYYL